MSTHPMRNHTPSITAVGPATYGTRLTAITSASITNGGCNPDRTSHDPDASASTSSSTTRTAAPA
ncbi:hypothetical protein [Cellulomonas massiliensis]|uniref:hypothetical protein n=1 Tax=Cellulomonas massiliensis TaxID=1465811 RepID=UPI0011C8638C|nr:hypothetical protein [Cellulomonas massiliensis]